MDLTCQSVSPGRIFLPFGSIIMPKERDGIKKYPADHSVDFGISKIII